MVHPCCALILQWCRKWRCVGTSVLVCGGQRLQAFPDKEYQVPDMEYQVPRQGISGSPTRNIRFPTGGYNLSNSKIIVFNCTFNLCSHMKMLICFGSEMVQNLLSVTVHLPALQTWSLQNIILPSTSHFPDWGGARIST